MRFIAEAVEITADPMTIKCQHFLGIFTDADAAVVRKDVTSTGELIVQTGATGQVYFLPSFAIETGPSGQINVTGVASGGGTVYVSK